MTIPGHKHTWTAGAIANGARGKKAAKTSTGYACQECRLVAKAPSKPVKGWTPAP